MLRRLVLCSALLIAACEPPREAQLAGRGEAKGEVRLTAAARTTVNKLREIAAHGDYRDMARLAETYPEFRSNAAGWRHVEFWGLKAHTGDWPTAALAGVFRYRPAEVASPSGRIFVWPYMAVLKPGEVTASAAHDMDELAGVGEAARVRAGSPWSGYSLAVRADGTWLYFVAGADEAPEPPDTVAASRTTGAR